MNFQESKTKENLMRAFAGESQARNRYLFAAGQAKNNKLHVIQSIFEYTADQERAHAKVFYNHLKPFAGENICVDGCYPVDISDNIVDLMRAAQHNEYQEHEHEYATFAKIAEEEGFPAIAYSFSGIAAIEKTHGDRFGQFADLIEQNKLFNDDQEIEWLCLNCGHIHKGKSAPQACPVCQHPQGFFIRLELSPFK